PRSGTSPSGDASTRAARRRKPCRSAGRLSSGTRWPPSSASAVLPMARDVIDRLHYAGCGKQQRLFIIDHRRVPLWSAVEQSKDDGFHQAVQHVADQRRKIELLPQEEHADESRDYREGAEYLADLAEPNAWNCGI